MADGNASLDPLRSVQFSPFSYFLRSLYSKSVQTKRPTATNYVGLCLQKPTTQKPPLYSPLPCDTSNGANWRELIQIRHSLENEVAVGDRRSRWGGLVAVNVLRFDLNLVICTYTCLLTRSATNKPKCALAAIARPVGLLPMQMGPHATATLSFAHVCIEWKAPRS